MSNSSSRRQFLKHSSTAVAAGYWVAGGLNSAGAEDKSPNEKLNIGVIGVGGRGAGDLAAVATQNIVALCDVDENRLNGQGKRFPNAKKYADFRKLLDQKDLDAVVVATPDHQHAPASIRAMNRGLHVYCEKPLTHTVEEARAMAKLAAEKKLVTQMGTQNHEHPGYLRLVELIQTKAIGEIHEVHVITDRPGTFWKQGLDRPKQKQSVPKNLSWNLWLGPAEERPYHEAYAPFRWRGWWDFGCGAIGDMAIHLMDPSFWALELNNTPVDVTTFGPPPKPDCGPTWMTARFDFPARGKRKPCSIYWYEGLAQPPKEVAEALPMNGSLFIGDEGKIAVAHGGSPQLLPKEKFAEFKAPDPYLPESPGHHKQWIDACKTGGKTGSNFGYAGPFTEVVLLGNISYRAGQSIHYDPASMKITNSEKANQLLRKEYRKGWEI